MRNAIVVFSGGQDSTTCLFWAIAQGYNEIHAVSFDYGQRHAIELTAAEQIITLAKQSIAQQKINCNITHETMPLHNLLGGDSPLTNPRETVARYESADTLPGGLEKTFVPGRNALFLTLCAARGYVIFDGAAFDLITGVSQADFGGYPDCREAFTKPMEQALNAALYIDGNNFLIKTPLIHLTKSETVQLMQQLDQQIEGAWSALGLSHTCYNGIRSSNVNGVTVVGCGQCHSCLLRDKGFQEAGYADPVLNQQ